MAPGAIDNKPAKNLAGQLPKVQLTGGRQEGEQLTNISHGAFARRRRCTTRDPQVLGESVEDVIKAVKCGCTEHGPSLSRHGMWRQAAHDYADPDHSGPCDPARTIKDAIERDPGYSAERGRAHNAAYAALCISGDPTPSTDDARLTLRLCAAADVLDMPLLDHLIVGDEHRYYSFREAGVLGATPTAR